LCLGGPFWAGLLPASLLSAVLKLLKMYDGYYDSLLINLKFGFSSLILKK
jgi:hypothetical protein